MWFFNLQQFLCNHEYHFCITNEPNFHITKAECVHCGKTIKDDKKIGKLLSKLKIRG